MNDKLLPWILLFFALGLSTTAAYYSVIGLSLVFSGVAIPVIVMGGFLEGSKLAIATFLHNQWNKTAWLLKGWLTLALIILSLITSIGIYGLLSKGFRANITELEINGKQVKNIDIKKERYTETKEEYVKEKQVIEADISQLRESLATGTKTQYKDRETGQIITVNSSSARKTFEKQLDLALTDRTKVSEKIEALNDSITKLEIQILDMETANEEVNELGVIQSASEITGWSLNTVANLFILILIIVFDPLAITLVISTNQAFKNSKTKRNMYGEPKKEEPTPTTVQKSTPPPPVESKSTPIDPNLDQQIESLNNQIKKIQNSGATGKKKGLAISNIQTQLKKLHSQKDNQITY